MLTSRVALRALQVLLPIVSLPTYHYAIARPDVGDAVLAKLEDMFYEFSHPISKAADALLARGALFYVTHETTGRALFNGFFVGKRVALTINHDQLFRASPYPTIHAVSSSTPPTELTFKVFHTDSILDFTVLILEDRHLDAPHFDIGKITESGVDVGLVNMGIGFHNVDKDARPPLAITKHKVHVNRLGTHHLYFSNTETFGGDSLSPILLMKRNVVAMHLEVINAAPEVPVEFAALASASNEDHPFSREATGHGGGGSAGGGGAGGAGALVGNGAARHAKRKAPGPTVEDLVAASGARAAAAADDARAAAAVAAEAAEYISLSASSRGGATHRALLLWPSAVRDHVNAAIAQAPGTT